MDYLINLTIFFSIYAILGLSLNLIVGYTGLLSVSQAAFYGIGAYATAILTSFLGVNFFLSVITGMLAAGLAAFVIGIVLSQLSGDYYALGSLGFNVIVVSIFLNWEKLTNGALGISGIARPIIFGLQFSNNALFLGLALLFLVIIYAACHFIVASSFGRVLKAIREDEEAIRVFGYNTVYYKLIIFIISASMAAVAGSLFASYLTFIEPTGFGTMESIFVLAIIILGGLANLRGSILGALFLITLPEILRFIGMPDEIAAQARQVVYGLILILLMLYRPQGLIGEYKL